MAYQPIVAESEVNDALERLESILGIKAVIDVSGDDATSAKKREVTVTHDKHGFWARRENQAGDRKAVTLGLIADYSTVIATIATRSKEDGDPWQLAGLFVSDSEGNRCITHSGRFGKGYHKTFRDHTGPDGWIDVDVEGGQRERFLVSQIDGIDDTSIRANIGSFVRSVAEYKKGGAGGEEETQGPQVTIGMIDTPLNTILYGPPGTGKTYLTVQRCVEICDGEAPKDDDKTRDRYQQLVTDKRVEFITFHESYGYEEFVEGLRPAPNEGGGPGFRLEPVPGVLKVIAERAKEHPGNAYVLVIDEINRANVSKVMGELITLLEEDKREGRPNEVAVALPHSRERFTLPPNLHVLGTMNTADRSIALIDTALRRRFRFEEMAPDLKRVDDKVEGINLRNVLKAINDRLEYLLDRDHLIGHAWLMKARTKAQVDDVMRHKIIPLLAEYFYDDWRRVQAVLGGEDGFVKGEELDRPPGLDADEEKRFRWTVQDEFTLEAYQQLVEPRKPRDRGQNSPNDSADD